MISVASLRTDSAMSASQDGREPRAPRLLIPAPIGRPYLIVTSGHRNEQEVVRDWQFLAHGRALALLNGEVPVVAVVA